LAGSGVETVGAAVVSIDGPLIWNKPPGSSSRFDAADAVDSFVAATLAARALRSMRPESSVLSGLELLDEEEASALKLGPLLAAGDEPTRDVSALSENNADCSSVPAPIFTGAAAFGAANPGASA
jgi:hypothetical protein